jgi:hypothetical protein
MILIGRNEERSKMMKLVPDTNVMVTTEEHDIISHEKAYVRMQAGCVWVYLLEDGARVGVAFMGPSRFAVDAIAETDVGAMGESVVGTLDGVQFYVGNHSLEDTSGPATSSHLGAQGFNSAESLVSAVKVAIEDQLNGHKNKTKIDKKPTSKIFLGRDADKKSVVLVIDGKGLVFTHGKTAFVLGDNNMVSVSKSGVAITNREGKNLIVGKGGIVGLDNFLDIGPIVTRSVSDAMKGLKSLKSMKSMKRSMRGFPYTWDDVDDFDWED